MCWHSLDGCVSVVLLFAMAFPLGKNIISFSTIVLLPAISAYSLNTLFCLLYHYTDAMQSCLLKPFKGDNTEAIWLYMIIFDGLYRSSILSSLLFTIDNTISLFIKFNNCSIWDINGPKGLIYSAALHGIYLSPCTYLRPALIQKYGKYLTIN